jgi:hypothetical protein
MIKFSLNLGDLGKVPLCYCLGTLLRLCQGPKNDRNSTEFCVKNEVLEILKVA